ncbi:uncharacterized protein LOC125519178 [Triticum urartu]|uniref:uncharacterized protein LOC125519178 n=1 Tax=Triticum urartu TaxID=4572 RepID=UPI002044048F|nr:uncharacterized protein LOC125519178 [Triticum urartu]
MLTLVHILASPKSGYINLLIALSLVKKQLRGTLTQLRLVWAGIVFAKTTLAARERHVWMQGGVIFAERNPLSHLEVRLFISLPCSYPLFPVEQRVGDGGTQSGHRRHRCHPCFEIAAETLLTTKLQKSVDFAKSCTAYPSGSKVFQSLKFYVKAYGRSIWPVRDKKFWKKTNNIHVHAPAVKVKKGRKQKNRRLAPKEIEDGTRLSRHGTVIHCGHCGVPGHNRGGCPDLKPNGKRKRVAEEDEFTVDDVQYINVEATEGDIANNPVNVDEDTLLSNMMDQFEARRRCEIQHHPMPQESQFVAAHREQLPEQRRVTTATARGMSLGLRRGKSTRGGNTGNASSQAGGRGATPIGRGAVSDRGREASTVGRGAVSDRGRGRGATPIGRGAVSDRGRGRGATPIGRGFLSNRGRGSTGRGRGYTNTALWNLCFGRGGHTHQQHVQDEHGGTQQSQVID